jgi:hypothetical protein
MYVISLGGELPVQRTLDARIVFNDKNQAHGILSSKSSTAGSLCEHFL